MTFWGFLGYLYGQWKKVWSFFSGWYNRAWEAATYGVRSTGEWLSRAIGYVNHAIAILRAWVSQLWRGLSDRINQLSSTLHGYNVLGWRQFIVGLVASIRNWVSNLISTALSTVRGWISQAVDLLKSWVTPLVDGVRRQIAPYVQLWKWLVKIWDWLKSLFHLFTTDFLSKLVSFVHGLFSFLLMFFNDPLGFIFGVIRDDLLPLILWLVAMGLSYDDVDLGDFRDQHGDAYEAGSGSIAVTGDGSKLPARPLANIWVSGYRFNPHHHGVDLGLAKGQPVYASHSGKVTVAGWSTVGYGNNVVISGNPWWSRYAHLESYAVRVGDNVDAGQMIGRGDSTGHSTGNHLHFEVKYKGRFVDPLTVIPPG